MVLESQGDYDSQWAAICSIAPKIGCTPETLRVWIRQHERDTGGRLTTAERQRLKELQHFQCFTLLVTDSYPVFVVLFPLPVMCRAGRKTAI